MNVSDIQNFFTAADTNHNGYLSASEFQKAIASKATDIQQNLSAFLNDKGKINKAAFNAVAGDDKKMTQAELLALLTTTDDDDNVTVLDNSELQKQYNNLSTISTIDTNGDGKIAASEILKVYQNAEEGSDVKNLLANFVETNAKGKLQVNKSKLRVLSGGKSYITYQDLLKADTDSSGMTSGDEMSAYFEPTKIFTSIDSNGDGKLSTSEILKAYNNAEDGSDVKEYLENFVSTNEKGKLQVNKAKVRLLSGGNTYLTYDDLLKTDADKNETATAEEVKSYFEPATAFTSVDANGDGKLSTSEILKAYNNTDDAETKNLLANFVETNAKGKLQVNKSKIRVLSDGKTYLTYEDLLKTDEDSNGTATSEEVSSYMEASNNFTTVDTNGDGKLSAKEILTAYNNVSSSTELKALLSNLVYTDSKGKIQVNKSKLKVLADGKGYLTFTDLLKADSNADKITSPEELKTLLSTYEEFCKLDVNGDGKTTLDEMKKYAKTATDSLLANYIASLVSSKEMKRVFKILSDGKNYITAADLAKYDTNQNGVICSGELQTFKNLAKGIVLTTTTTTVTA